MKKLLLMSSVALFLASAATVPAVADGKNWTAEKAATIDANRNSNAGIGNGGERKRGGNWLPTNWGEDGPRDVDPGNSGDHNQACPDTGVPPRRTAC